MIKASESIIIQSTPEAVFIAASDPEQQLKWDAGHFTKLKKLTSGPIEKGSAFRCVIPWLGAMTYEFAEYDPPRQFAHRSKMFINHGYHVFEFQAVPEGTRFNQTMQVWPRGPGYLLYPFMKFLLKKSLRTLSTGLKTYMESQATREPVTLA